MTPVKPDRKRWTPAATDALFAQLEITPSYAATAAALGLTAKTVVARIHTLRLAGDPRIAAPRKMGPNGRQMPEDFAEHAANEQNKMLAERYGASRAIVARWRREAGVRRDRAAPVTPIARAARVRKAGTTGSAPRLVSSFSKRGGVAVPLDRDEARDMSEAGQAAYFLKRLGPVVRCDEHGKTEGAHTHWRRGSFILTGEEIIDRALRNGWKPDEWRKIAA